MVQPVKSDVNDVSPELAGLPDVFAAALALQRTPTHAQQGSRAPYSNQRARLPSWNPNGVLLAASNWAAGHGQARR
jgi:hypothetical protein